MSKPIKYIDTSASYTSYNIRECLQRITGKCETSGMTPGISVNDIEPYTIEEPSNNNFIKCGEHHQKIRTLGRSQTRSVRLNVEKWKTENNQTKKKPYTRCILSTPYPIGETENDVYEIPTIPTLPSQKPAMPPNVMIPSGKSLDSFLPLARDPINSPMPEPNPIYKQAPFGQSSKRAGVDKFVPEKIDINVNNAFINSPLEINQKSKDKNGLTNGKRTRDVAKFNHETNKVKNTKPMTKKNEKSINSKRSRTTIKENNKSIICRRYGYGFFGKKNYNSSDESSDFEVDPLIAQSAQIKTSESNSKVARRNTKPGYYSANFSSDEEETEPKRIQRITRNHKPSGCYTANFSSDEDSDADAGH
ncbi:3463_t:CDS:1 [Ambispora gerdemannii]|uniref:3463_t:CDS:1 n=1 Tax=Ambispora gerdemannii TaxID=144530 RepID=A0A9N8YR29_9GLOM|nr:3463_t:CDS:1 [Ambispora gerdemannii]